jgi:hypothetical protein
VPAPSGWDAPADSSAGQRGPGSGWDDRRGGESRQPEYHGAGKRRREEDSWDARPADFRSRDRNSGSPPREPPQNRSRLAGMLGEFAANRPRSQQIYQEKAATQKAAAATVFIAKFPVDPHVKGHDKEYKLPPTPFGAPTEVAAVRCDRKTGEYSYTRACQMSSVVPPKTGVDLTTSRSGSELCGS